MRASIPAAIILATATAGLVLVGCASDEGGGAERPAQRLPTRPLPNVFISPEGEPFHAATGAPYPVAVWFARADTDHDGRLTRAEFRQDAALFFSRLDTNHDGVLDGGEVSHYEEEVAPEILPIIGRLRSGEGTDTHLVFGDGRNRAADNEVAGRYREPEQPGDPRDVGLQGAGIYGLMNEPEPVAAADTQFDGRITRDEFQAAADRRFDMLDKKGLGYLTLATLPKTPVQVENLRRAKLRRNKPPEPDTEPGS